MDRRSKFTFRHQHNISYPVSTECWKYFWSTCRRVLMM